MDVKKIGLFLAFAFGISWLTAVLIYALDISLSNFTATAIIACLYMPAPAISALIVQKYIYQESLEQIGWKWSGINWKWIVLTIMLAISIILGTLAVMYLGGNLAGIPAFGTLDFTEDGIIQKLGQIIDEASGGQSAVDIESSLEQASVQLTAPLLIAGVLISAIFAAFTVNLPFMFGEEFGWRGLLIQETQQMGFFKSNLFIGLVWGLWHAPVILMGHNYPEYPVVGVAMMVVFCAMLSFPFAYVRYKTKSILGPCVLHGMINGTAALTLYFTRGGHSLVTGMTGLAGFIVIAIVFVLILLDKPFISTYGTNQ